MHTPGPWTIGQPDKHPLTVQKHEPDEDWYYTVANCGDGTLPTEQLRANAKLIAMAPTLLEHRAQLLAALKDTLLHSAVGNHWDCCECYICRNKQLLASIEAQMKGEG